MEYITEKSQDIDNSESNQLLRIVDDLLSHQSHCACDERKGEGKERKKERKEDKKTKNKRFDLHRNFALLPR